MPQSSLELQFDTPPANWAGNVAQFVDLLQSLGVITIPEGTGLMWVGANPPNSDQGPGFNTSLKQFQYWDGASGSYKTIATSSNIGEICMFAFAALDANKFVVCEGQAIPRAAPYDSLFSKIGVTFGAGDGGTTFNVPDMRGRVPVGAGTGTGLTARALGANFGEEKHVLTADEMPAVTGSSYNAAGNQNPPQVLVDTKANAPSTAVGNINGAGNPFGNGHNNIQPSKAIVFAIRYA